MARSSQPTIDTVQSQKLGWWAGIPVKIRHGILAYGFMLPYLLVFFFFMLLPAVVGAGISLTKWGIMGDPEWVGLKNYGTIFNHDTLKGKDFWRAFGNTLEFTVLTVIPMVGGGLLLALLLNQKLRGRVVARTMVFIPYAIMVTVVGLLWRWIYDRNFGLLNYYLPGASISWLVSLEWAMIAVAITSIWWQIGTNLVIYLAGLQEIPQEFYDAAKVDGANAFHCFWHITIPGLRLMHIFVIPMSVITSMRVFGQVQVMTQGGPVGRTLTLVQHLYNVGWVNFKMGEAAAIGVSLFAVTFFFTVLQLRFFRAFDDEDKVPSPPGPISTLFGNLWHSIASFWGMIIDTIAGTIALIWGTVIRPFNQLFASSRSGRGVNWASIIGYPLIVIVTLLWAVPTIWMFSTALKPEGKVRELPIEWIPSNMTFENFSTVVQEYPIVDWFLNSTFVAMTTTVLALACYALAAYPLAFYRFRGRQVLFLGIMATMLIPIEATMIPLYLALSKLGKGIGVELLYSHFSLVMPVTANAFGLYLLVQFFQTIPHELREAARIDGCSEFGIFWRIILPLSRPALTTAAIFTFMASWNNFVWPFIASNNDTRTLPVGLAIKMGSITGSPASMKYGMVMAGSVLATLPPMLIFIFLQRYFVQGISMTGIKG